MRKKGSAMVYVLILLIPVMILALALADLTSVDLKINVSIVKSQQAYYNAEAGIKNSLEKLSDLNYPETYNANYYLTFNTNPIGTVIAEPPVKDFAWVSISGGKDTTGTKKVYSISSTGNYMGFKKLLTKSVSIDIPQGGITSPFFSLKRKFMVGSLGVMDVTGRVRFLDKNKDRKSIDEKFLLFMSTQNGLNYFENSDGFTFLKNTGFNSKVTTNTFFNVTNLDNSLPLLKTTNAGVWKKYEDKNIYYYISNGNITIDKTKLTGASDDFMTGFRNYRSGVRVLLVNGDVILDGINGYTGKNKTYAIEYMNNLVIYCTGSIIIKNCDIQSGANGNNGQSDVNMCFITRNVEFYGDNVFSYFGGNANKDLIMKNEASINNIIASNINSAIDWK